MSTGYGENEFVGIGEYVPQKRVNFGWLGEAWRLFSQEAPLWVSATLLGIYAPLIFDGLIFAAVHQTSHASTIATTFAAMQPGLKLGITLLNVIYAAYFWNGLNRLALKQVTGQLVTIRDIFNGGNGFALMLIYTAVYAIAVNLIGMLGAAAGQALKLPPRDVVAILPILEVLPALLISALLLPGFSMVADGVGIVPTIVECSKTIWRDRFVAMALVFVIQTMIFFSVLVFGLGPVVTLPIFVIASALAYRDLIGLKNTGPAETVDAILGVEHVRAATGIILTGEPVAPSSGLTLSGDPIDETSPTS